MELSNNSGSPIKISTVAEDHTTGLAVGPSTTNYVDDVLQKVGVQLQSGEQEVTGEDLSVGTLEQANASLAMIDAAIEKVSSFRSSFGAVENRLDASINNLTTLQTILLQQKVELWMQILLRKLLTLQKPKYCHKQLLQC